MQLVAAGSNAQGQLATGSLEDAYVFSPVLFESLNKTHEVLSVACGANHTLVLVKATNSDYHELWGSGDGTKGQLGPLYRQTVEESGGSTSQFRRIDLNLRSIDLDDSYSPQLIAVAWESSFVVLRSKEHLRDVLVSMGGNDFGDLGIGVGAKGEGKTPVTAGPHIVQLHHLLQQKEATSMRITTLAAGPHHIILTLESSSESRTDQVCVGWGSSRHGQIGAPAVSPFVSHPRVIPLLSRVESLALGNQHTLLLNSEGRVTAIGSSRKGQLDGVMDVNRVRKISCTWNGSYLVIHDADYSWSIYAVGSNNKGQLGRGDGPSPNGRVQFPFDSSTHRYVDLACGSEHVLVLFSLVREENATEVWSWGWNEHGNLGLSHNEDVHTPVRIWPPTHGHADSGKAVSIWAGCGTSWIGLGD